MLAALLLAAVTWDLRDTHGQRHTLADARDNQAVVLFFLAPDCPLSNRYGPELRRFYEDYAPRGVAFYAVGRRTGIPSLPW